MRRKKVTAADPLKMVTLCEYDPIIFLWKENFRIFNVNVARFCKQSVSQGPMSIGKITFSLDFLVVEITS